MAQSRKGKLNYRCPNCFTRDIDIDMFYDASKDEYYCLRCGYVGKEKDVLEANENLKKKYKWRMKRVVSFNGDDEEITWKDHNKGEF